MIQVVLFAVTALGGPPPPGGWPEPPQNARVESVYDGDTVTLDTGDRVRLRWVNTPERKPPEPFAEEARQAAERMVGSQQVELVVSPETRDGYGRIIAGLRTGDGDLSAHLLELGLAHLFIIPPEDADLGELQAAQEKARAARRGIWSTDPFQGSLYLTSFHANASGDDRKNVNGEYMRLCNVGGEPLDLEGYVVENRSGRRFVLPHLVVPPGHTVKIHSGTGTHQVDAARQLVVYLGSTTPIWNNDGDRATILDPSGRTATHRDR